MKRRKVLAGSSKSVKNEILISSVWLANNIEVNMQVYIRIMSTL